MLVVALVLAAPAAAAVWRAPGGLEPDTLFDAGRMFADPDTSASARKVYFHGFQALAETSANPNVATLGTRFLPPAAHHRAILGVWKDCNADGYIGLAETALTDYRAEVLSSLSLSICPAVTGSVSPVHNDGAWVNELLAIGMVDPCEFQPDAIRTVACPGVDAFARSERVLYANDTFVWADLGAPGSIPRAECALAPPPRGTTSGSGPLVTYLDCQGQRGLGDAIAAADPDGQLDQRFPLTPFGAPGAPGLLEEDATPSASVWDCRDARANEVASPVGPQAIQVEDPSGGRLDAQTFPWVVPYTLTGVGFEDGALRIPLTDEDGDLAWTPALSPELGDPAAASTWAALAAAADGPRGDCDPETGTPLDAASPQRHLESHAPILAEARKDRASFTFVFYDGHRGVHADVDPTLGAGAPSDGGLSAMDHGRGGDGPLWSATTSAQNDPHLVRRDDLRPAGPAYFTYYAHLGAEARDLDLQLPTSATYGYGRESCGLHTSGIHGGWNCDAAQWWKDAHGDDVTPRYALDQRIGRLPGDPYHLRDVDCYDGELARHGGIHASLQDIQTEPPCGAWTP